MDHQQPGNLSAVPPPPSLTGNSAPVNFNDALSKARAIAEKLKKQNTAATPAPPAAAPSGTKRGYRDDPYDDEYSSRSTYRGNYYDDQRDTKRGMYDRYESSSRPRYGLGSEERKAASGGYGGGDYANDSVVQDDCSVPNHMVGVVIGKGGDNLKKIERMSGAKVQIATDTGDTERKVHMTGEADQVKIARDMIQQIVDDTRSNEASRYPAAGARPSYTETAPAMSSYGPRSGGTTMTVPSSKVGLIIGRKGETIRDLEDRSGAKITIAAETGNERSGERCINIVGEPTAVQRARALIDEIASDDPHSSTAP
ncbi:hypothetical protein BJV82DRAFT_30236 [Fennellomyces sp. T-0311]|nr:hypothetical protein BJV82DRAFT_30236 [Fennellomyces sp. T-0311]